MIDIISLLTSSTAKFIIAPLLTIVLGNALKLLCQDRTMKSPWRNYFYCGPNALSAAFLISLVDVCSKANKFTSIENAIQIDRVFINNLLLLVIVFVVSVPLMISLLQRYGWKNDQYGYKIRWRGIFLSDIIGLIVLFITLSLLK